MHKVPTDAPALLSRYTVRGCAHTCTRAHADSARPWSAPHPPAGGSTLGRAPHSPESRPGAHHPEAPEGGPCAVPVRAFALLALWLILAGLAAVLVFSPQPLGLWASSRGEHVLEMCPCGSLKPPTNCRAWEDALRGAAGWLRTTRDTEEELIYSALAKPPGSQPLPGLALLAEGR